MTLQIADFWYAIKPAAAQVVQLREIYVDPYLGGNLWVLNGSERSLVIDTGTGMQNPLPVLQSLTNRPLPELGAVACNGWYDHAGGLHCFSDRICHQQDAAIITKPTPESSAATVYVNAAMLSAIPDAHFELSAYRMQGTVPTRTVNEGDIIDLGDRQLEVLHVPGMTSGSIALWEAATGSLFTSDTLYDDPFADQRADELESPPTYNEQQHKQSLIRLCELPVVTVFPGHFSSFGRARMLQLIDEILTA